ncbi:MULTISPECIES: calcium-translocating P-type ATPase, PMCA-type [Capnocytophaga]|uniref:P-type Ca(2+) transporter n=1 Tax=Capnocytophaga canis TaxID=1848903 RepID=A0A3A1YHC8_9FLAO|nr:MULTISPECIES: calcium-translocating P-type ATPase, PMCA-type [Capnocytophaga]RIY37552.1 calcium-translocating P-type ATPase, PMCA-type [Capnocytophaga canis]GIM58309.1 calcium-translocating P-type ATPase, PMCA-type [Capnocytophaga canimorsus]
MENKHYQGLSPNQVEESRKKYGTNEFSQVEKEPLWRQFLEKFQDPIIVILLVALVASFGVSIYEYIAHDKGINAFFEPIGILFAILLATSVAFYFELKANKQFEILNQVNDDIHYKVIREGQVTQVLKKDIVVGDIVLLETGEEIPADGKLLQSISLQVNESTLTGEPLVSKTTDEKYFDKEATYPSNYLCRGTSVMDGHCIFEVEKVGDFTEYGKVFEGVQIDDSIQTPLNRQLDGLANTITKVSYILAVLVIVGRLVVYFNQLNTDFDWISFGGYFLNTLMIAITVIVVAVPEGLPMSVTLSLAYSMRRMMATSNLVRRMHACETMGATTVICTDKTGTLTQNQMKIYDVFGKNFSSAGNEQYANLITEAIATNSTAYLDFSDKEKIQVLGNPTEGALLLWLNENKKDYLSVRENSSIIAQLTFSTERKFMATLVKSKVLDKYVLYVKGAPEIVMNFCNDGGKFNSDISQEEYFQKLAQYQSQAMRTIGFAYKVFDTEISVFQNGQLTETGLTFMGVVAISDPIRTDVPNAIKECLKAGIQVKIITGDTPGTAKEIARQIGLWDVSSTDENHISGTEFASLSDQELRKKISKIKIVSRARPLDKARLVSLLQQQGEVVAVTGDGTNDAPALKTAQVGLSMGDGTSVAKEASDITIIDNSFSSIGKAVMWGRSLYLNIQRFILFQMTINVAACIIVLIGAFLGTESPLTVTQMLWVNLIMDTFAALALASLPPSKDVMNDKPRATNSNIISRSMAKGIFGVGGLFVVLLYGLIQYFKHSNITSLIDFSFADYFGNFFNFTPTENGLSPYELSLFFSIFVMLQFWNMFNAKAYHTGRTTFMNLQKSLNFLIIAVVIVLGQILITSFGGKMFNVVPLKVTDWIIITLTTSIVLWIGELTRVVSKN